MKNERKDRFAIQRKDGRSNTQVILGLVGDDNPGRIITYQAIIDALSEGTDRKFSRQEVQAAIRIAGPMLGKVHKRALQNVRTIGYRVALAVEHVTLAVSRQDRASRQLKRAFQTVRDVRMDEIKDPIARTVLENHRIILSGLCLVVQQQGRRLERHEALINGMLGMSIGSAIQA